LGNYKQVPRTSPLSSSSSRTWAPTLLAYRWQCFAPAAALPPSQRHLLLGSPPRVALILSRSSSSPLVASRARTTTTPERPPAATSSSPWIAHREALTLGLSHATASLQCLPSVLPVPVPNFEHSTHIPPPPSSLAPATHGIPVGNHHRTSSVPIHPCASFPVAH
jgi:hypothetical protein